MDLSAFCDNDMPISEYLRLITIWEMIIARIPPAVVIIPRPATCPAEVILSNEIKPACIQDKPFETARIPKVKDTDRYPKPMGRPSLTPSPNVYPLKSVSFGESAINCSYFLER